jgi:hypothetical protein
MNRNLVASLILGPIFAIVGYVVAFHLGKPILDNAAASKNWPSVNGAIVESNVSTRRSDGKTMYSPNISYKYSVDGKEYRSSTIYFGDDGSSSSNSGRLPDATQKESK